MKLFMLAWRNVWRNSRRTALSVGVICVGVTAILIAWGFITATFWGLSESTIATGIGHIQIGSKGSFDTSVYFDDPGMPKDMVDQVTAFCEKQPEVRFSMMRVNFEGLITFKNTTVSFSGTGIEPGKEARLSGVYAPLLEGDNLPVDNDSVHYDVLIAGGLAKSLDCHPGDSVSILVNMPGGGLNAVDLTVCGIYQTGFPETDKRNILVPIGVSWDLFGTTNVNRILVSLDKTSSSHLLAQRIAKEFPNLEVHTWEDLAVYYKQVVQLYSSLFRIFGFVIMAVAFLSIINTMFMSIMERIREIGTLLAMGLDEKFVSSIFLVEGMIIGAIGWFLGVIVTAAISLFVNNMNFRMPPAPGRTMDYPLSIFMDLPSVVVVLLAILVCSGTAALIPSVRAAKKSIVVSLSHN